MTDSIIVSLTTYGKRIETVYRVIDSLLTQRHQADKIILWLDESEFSIQTVPSSLRQRVSEKFEINFCPNYKSYKKLIPSIQLYPDSIIITVDDDFEYPPDLVHNLYQNSLQYPDSVIASRGRIMNIVDGELQSYPSWEFVDLDEALIADYCAVPIGYAGILYPAGILHDQVTNNTIFQKLAPHADDLWFKAMTLLNGKSTVILPLFQSLAIKTIEGTQDNALYMTHNAGDANTKQMNDILSHFSELSDLIRIPDFYKASYSALKIVRDRKKSVISHMVSERVLSLRTAALSIEKFDVSTALSLMELAKAIRPEGPLINQKIVEYKEKLGRA